MIKKIKWRFILFNIVVIGSLLAIMYLFMYMGFGDNRVRHHILPSVLVTLIGAFFASLIISKAAVAPIQKAWQKQLDFTAAASHELRTPVAIIQSSLEIIMENQDETVASQEEWLQNIYVENKRMTGLINDLLLLSRADSNQQLLEIEDFELGELLDETVSVFLPIAAEKQIDISAEHACLLPMQADRKKIRQLITILVNNAIQYTNPGGKVHILADRKAKHIVLSVEDNGIGIASEDQKRIFERFYRADKARKCNDGGSGLGLAIAKWIVEAHKGEISVVSELGKGTGFTVKFAADGKEMKE